MDITFKEAASLYKKNPERTRLIDVREADEYQEGHLPKADLCPLSQLVSLTAQGAFKDQDLLLLYCRSGARSGRACEFLRKKGFKEVYNCGGVLDYQGEFGPLEK